MNKYIKRIFEPKFLQSIDSNQITVLLGPRQVGKTTTINHFLDNIEPNRKLTLNFDSSFVRKKVLEIEDFIRMEIEKIARKPIEEINKFYLFIDEVQKCPEAIELIKIIYDTHPAKIKIILSGSSALQMKDRLAETLSGRIHSLYLFPFSLSENYFLEYSEDIRSMELFKNIFSIGLNREFLLDFEKSIRYKKESAEKIIKERTTSTLFPKALIDIEKGMHKDWLIDYIDTYIEKDIRDLKELYNITLYRSTLSQYAMRIGSLIKYESIGRDVGADYRTIQKYIYYINRSLIGYQLPPYFQNFSKILKKSQKAFMADNGLINALMDFPEFSILEASGKIGNLFENLIIAEFKKHIFLSPARPSLYYWYKTDISEVDLILAFGGNLIPIEIKWQTEYSPNLAKGLTSFKNDYKGPMQIPFSLLIYNGPLKFIENNTYCIPAYFFAV